MRKRKNPHFALNIVVICQSMLLGLIAGSIFLDISSCRSLVCVLPWMFAFSIGLPIITYVWLRDNQ